MKLLKYYLLLLLIVSATLKADELPKVTEQHEALISSRMEKKLGKEFMREIKKHLHLIHDPIINNYVNSVGNMLVAHTRAKNKEFNFFIVNDPSLNAFAGPDANIGVNSGTITALRSESELAAIIAHEIAHVSQHHILQLIARAKKTQIATAAGMLAAIIVGTTSSGNAVGEIATSTAIASMGAGTQHMISFTREHEIEADNIGIKILYNSGYNPKAAPAVFERLSRLRFDHNKEIPRFLLTHPVTVDRISEAKNRIAQYPAKKWIKPNNTFDLIRTRTEVLTTNNIKETIRHFKAKIAASKLKNQAAYQYGYALALFENLQLEKAAKITAKLLDEHPNELLFRMLGAEIAINNKQPEQAISTLEAALIHHADYEPLITQYARTLILAKHSITARDFLRKKIRKNPENADLYWLLAQAYSQNNQLTYAYMAKASSYRITGHYRQAVALLEQALKTPKLNTTDKAVINARIARLKEFEKNL